MTAPVCHECDTPLLPADDFDCEQVSFVCPECAPAFVVANSTTHADVDDPLA